jgi:flagellin
MFMSSLTINTNVAALNAQRNLGKTQGNLQLAIERLSTGFRINSAADDAAGLAITDRMTAQIKGLDQAVRNANDGVSTLQTADSSLQSVTDLLQRARELSVQSANDSNSSSDRQSLQSEVGSIVAELDRLANTVSFNGKKLLDGTFAAAQFQVGAYANQTIAVSIGSVQTKDTGATIIQGNAVSNTALNGSVAQQLLLNGVAIGISSATTIEGVVVAINNNSFSTGVSALKNSQTTFTDTAGTYAVAAGSSSTLTLNGVNIILTTGNSDAISSFVATVNQYRDQTGVAVSTSATGVVYTRASGGDIALSEATSAGSSTTVVGDVYASSSSRTFNAGITLSVALGGTIVVSTSANEIGAGFATTGGGALASTNKQVSTLNIGTASGANDAIQTLDFALTQIGKLRGSIGAVQNRFTSTIGSLQVASENISAARSRIKDADIAHETAELTRNQILTQAGVSVLAQANQLPQSALALLGGR